MRRFFSVYDTKNRLYRVKEERLLEYKLTSPSQQHPERNEIIELFFKDGRQSFVVVESVDHRRNAKRGLVRTDRRILS